MNFKVRALKDLIVMTTICLKWYIASTEEELDAMTQISKKEVS